VYIAQFSVRLGTVLVALTQSMVDNPGYDVPVNLKIWVDFSHSLSLGHCICNLLKKTLLLLGRVDELFDHNPCGYQMNKRQKGPAQFVIPRGNTAKLLEVIEEPFHFLA
jgi:hypothetical protein